MEGHHQTAITTNLVSSINARGEGVPETILCDKVLSVTFDNSQRVSQVSFNVTNCHNMTKILLQMMLETHSTTTVCNIT